MRARLLIVALMLAPVALLADGNSQAWAADGDGQNNVASAQASGGELTVEAGHTFWTPPAGSSWANDGKGDSSPGTPATANPDRPYGCRYMADPSATGTIGVGGAQPGEWVIPICSGPGDVDPMPPVWVTDARPGVVTVAVNPVVVAEQAVHHLGLGSPSIEMAPPPGSAQLVGVATWLWIDPGDWANKTATATAGAVKATATAAPTRVVWDMGDGHTLGCDGPGTPYIAADGIGSSGCSYTWPSAGSYTVTATVYWSVTWTAAGAAGGGNLGVQAGPPARVQVTVTESQAINTPPGGGN